MFPVPESSSQSIRDNEPQVPEYNAKPESVIPPLSEVSTVTEPLAGTVRLNHTSPPEYAPQPGSATPLSVAPTLVKD